jgi:hypothetical protein
MALLETIEAVGRSLHALDDPAAAAVGKRLARLLCGAACHRLDAGHPEQQPAPGHFAILSRHASTLAARATVTMDRNG